ncbi:hypothetical protein FQA39_LY13783 [Lamprigera yunnana]|nr:hypothetical protein FQA39_LY13783 [Lamprigera yunnana]
MSDPEKETSSESEEDSSDEEERALAHRAATLEAELRVNKYLYEAHVEVVDIYKKMGDLKSMREAYNRFSEYYPLTPTIWLNWLNDEILLATTPVHKKNVLALFQRAVQDYLSVEIWLKYIYYSIQTCEMEETYKVLEQALSAAGLDANLGYLLWDLLLELKLSHLDSLEKSSEKWNQEVLKVVEAFKRQLSVPSMKMKNAYEKWKEWIEKLPKECNVDTKPVEWGYQQALKLLHLYEPFEKKLSKTTDKEDLYNIYKEYINITANPVAAICLYERAVTQLSLNTTLWSDYCMFTLHLGDLSCDVSKKALRNCPWSEDLWIIRMRTLEYQKCDKEVLLECFEQGLTSIVPHPGLNLWLSYIEYLRRSSSSPEQLHKLIQQGSETLGENGDPTFKLLRLQARLHARDGNMTEARRIWFEILSYESHNQLANVWLEFILLEKQFGKDQQLRKLYQQAIRKCTDWPQYIAEDWMMYERECGSLHDMLKCIEMCKNIRETIEPIPTNEHKKRQREHDSNNYETKRFKSMEDKTSKLMKKKVNVSDIDPDKSIFLSNMHENVTETTLSEVFPNAVNMCIPTDRKGISRCFAYVQFEDANEVEKALARDREPLNGRPLFISKCLLDQTQRKNAFKYAVHNEENKLFVRGLPKKFSHEDVENIFKPYNCVAVRIVLHRSGQSKGLAYVEFKDKDAAETALKATDQSEVEGHVITVVISSPPQKRQSNELDTLIPVRRSRLQIPLIPRAIQTKSSENNIPGSSKTNEDFRKMFNK